jgi:hypothetical protein
MIAAVAAVGGAVVAGSAAGAADSDFLFFGDAMGTRILALNNTITSGGTAESGVFGGPSPQFNSNQTAAVNAQGIIATGAVNSQTQIKAITGGWKVIATAKTAGVSILNGAIRVDAITTTATITEVNGVLTPTVTNQFVGLHIVGVSLPANIPQNFGVKLGSIAQIGINTGAAAAQGNAATAMGAGLQIRLLEPAGSAETGASIYVSPVQTIVGPQGGIDTGHTTAGQAYGTKVTANVGSLIGIKSDPTAPVTVFVSGTSGHTITNSTASVRLGTGLNLGAVKNTGFGSNTTSGAFVHMTSEVATLNLFSGLIKAKAITADATASSNGTVTGNSQLVGLTIGGHPINLNAGPNTTIDVLHLGQVTINQQIRTAHGIIVRALDIVIGTRRNGLPVGAEVQVAVAAASAT